MTFREQLGNLRAIIRILRDSRDEGLIDVETSLGIEDGITFAVEEVGLFVEEVPPHIMAVCRQFLAQKQGDTKLHVRR